MPKPKAITLKGIVREIDRVENELKKARTRATGKGKKKISLAIKDLNKIRREVKGKCIGVYIVVPVYAVAMKRGS